jgi:hypothetical protein
MARRLDRSQEWVIGEIKRDEGIGKPLASSTLDQTWREGNVTPHSALGWSSFLAVSGRKKMVLQFSTN